MNNSSLIIVGAGAAGMVAAIEAARAGAKVTLIEKRERAGRKLLITGKGRCNITNSRKWSEFKNHIYSDKTFFKTLFNSFSNVDTVTFFEQLGVKVETQAGGRVFPISERSTEIVDALVKEINRLKVTQYYNCGVDDIIVEQGRVKEVSTLCGRKIECDALIVATGGLSYPSTGSTGDGYPFAQKVGHTLVNTFPSLTALKPSFFNETFIGVFLKNVSIKLFVEKDYIVEHHGDLEFTQNGLEGSLTNRISRRVVKSLINGNRCYIEVDLKPGVEFEKLYSRIERELTQFKGNSMRNFLKGYLPQNFILPFIEATSLPYSFNSNKLITEQLTISLKSWRLELVSFTGYERAIITAGGVATAEINPKTMSSKLCENLFFAGEIVDLDGDTGGYNLQIAFSTGVIAGRAAAYFISKL